MNKASSLSEAASSNSRAGRVALGATARKIGVYLCVALCIFLLGLVPMWLKAREAASQRDASRRELRLSQMQGTLASAVIDARRGDYEPARQTASDFFTALRNQIDGVEGSVLTARQRGASAPLLAQRDDIITLLARSDPASADRLSDLYVAYRTAVNELTTGESAKR